MIYYDILCMLVCTFSVLHLHHFPGVSSLLSELMEVHPPMAPLGTGTSRFEAEYRSSLSVYQKTYKTKPDKPATLDPFNVYFECQIFQNS